MRNHFRDKKSSTLSPDWWVFFRNDDAGDREERTGSPVLSFFVSNASEIMAARSAIYFRYGASRPAPLRHCRLAYTSIRQFRFLFRFSPSLPHCAGIRSRFFLFFPSPSIRLPSRSQEGLAVRRVKGGCDLLAPSVRSTTYDFRRQDSGRRSRDRLEWLETEMDFPGDIRCILYPK